MVSTDDLRFDFCTHVADAVSHMDRRFVRDSFSGFLLVKSKAVALSRCTL